MDKATVALLGMILAIMMHEQFSKPFERPWEYTIETIDDSRFDKKMEILGLQGWEIASCRRATSALHGALYECILKRPAQDIDGVQRKIERAQIDLSSIESAVVEDLKKSYRSPQEDAESDARLHKMAEDVNRQVAEEEERARRKSKAKRPCNRPWPETCDN